MKVKLKRIKREESKIVPLWYEGKNVRVTVVGGPGDTRMRITSPKGRVEIGFPLFTTRRESFQYWRDKVQEHEKEFKRAAERKLKEMG